MYVDGANLNALLGFAKPGEFGGDVSHLNLHKTFCIPHGGGGPGVGPVAVRAHLAPYLPSHPMHPEPEKREGIGPISAAPYGSAGILPISWAYIRLMGGPGLTRATAVAVLSANYIAHRLADHFPVLYRGHGGLVAHECILDVRGLTKDSGVSVDDVAKRLVDYGFHAPTMSFPVAGTLMVEPTESEDLGEIDRFCDAMIAIKGEIDRVQAGEWTPENSPLRHAPHTARALVGEWDRVLLARGRRLPDRDRPRQVLAAGRAHRPGVRRPQPRLRLPAARGVRRMSPPSPTSPPTACAGGWPRRRPTAWCRRSSPVSSATASWRGPAGSATCPGPLTDTQYKIGSITKTFTAVLILQLVEEGAAVARRAGLVGAGRRRLRRPHRSGSSSPTPVGCRPSRPASGGSGRRAGRSSRSRRPMTGRLRRTNRIGSSTTPTSASGCSARSWPACAARRGGRPSRSGS